MTNSEFSRLDRIEALFEQIVHQFQETRYQFQEIAHQFQEIRQKVESNARAIEALTESMNESKRDRSLLHTTWGKPSFARFTPKRSIFVFLTA